MGTSSGIDDRATIDVDVNGVGAMDVNGKTERSGVFS
jgi:hypothetical protein